MSVLLVIVFIAVIAFTFYLLGCICLTIYLNCLVKAIGGTILILTSPLSDDQSLVNDFIKDCDGKKKVTLKEVMSLPFKTKANKEEETSNDDNESCTAPIITDEIIAEVDRVTKLCSTLPKPKHSNKY